VQVWTEGDEQKRMLSRSKPITDVYRKWAFPGTRGWLLDRVEEWLSKSDHVLMLGSWIQQKLVNQCSWHFCASLGIGSMMCLFLKCSTKFLSQLLMFFQFDDQRGNSVKQGLLSIALQLAKIYLHSLKW